jgi:hypothetical protein
MTGARALAAAAWLVLAQVAPPGPPPEGGVPPAAPAPPTAIEAYLAQPGRLLVERRFALPPIPAEGGAQLVLEAIVAFEPGREQERVLGVRASGGGASAYLDLHEVEDLARTLAAVPAVLEPERAQRAAVELRFRTRDGFGVAVTSGAAGARRLARFAGPPPAELALSEPALAELRAQLDACRRYLFAE